MEHKKQNTDSQECSTYGWVVVAVSCISLAMFFGIESSFGVFYKALSSDFQLNGMALSAVFALGAISRGVFSFIYGWFCDYFGPRWTILIGGLLVSLGLYLTSRASEVYQLYLFYSLLVGMSCACSFVPLTSTVSRWFVRRRGIAVGIVTGGIGAGTLIMAPISSYLLENIGWRVSYLILSLIALGIVLITITMVRNPNNKSRTDGPDIHTAVKIGTQEGTVAAQTGIEPQIPFKQAVRNTNYWFIIVIAFAACLSSNIPILILVNHATNTGIGATMAAGILGTAGGASVAGRFLGGAISGKSSINLILLIALLVQGLTIAGFLFTQSPLSFFLVAILFGLSWGMCVPIFPIMIARYFGTRSMGAIFGLQFFGGQIGAALGPFLAGFSADLTGNYMAALIIGATVSIAGAFLCLAIKTTTKEAILFSLEI